MTHNTAPAALEWRDRARAVVQDLTALARTATQLPHAPGYRHRPETITVPPPAPSSRQSGPVRPTHTPVLLVHGYLTTEQCWTPLLRRLHRAGFRDTSCLRYNTLTTGIPQIAAALTDAARAAMDRTASGNVHLIGYSLGGLAVRYAVQHLGLDTGTRTAVTIATPHHGSPWAKAAPGIAAPQMRPGSTLLTTLPDLAAGHPVRWLLVHSDSDPVVPAGSATAGRSPDAVHVPGCGHLGLVTDPRTAEVVTAHLCHAETDAVTVVPRPLHDAA
ncbi:alpha/beta hydrolase [Streptomyces poonensis]|uniref:DUF676 domain-containing protein n=1 Tax=Streptomyces poonensis TaxID=68255 RepID=A0A918PD18_9ACTN|nr:hypothetical protein [Streptomyces poonensis]GGY98985.1 hypothetical protein GCM10010365_17090 [Streptomyces poonensis]